MRTGNKGGLLEHRIRYIILLLGWICLASIFSNTIILYFTFICMSGPVSNNQTSDTVTIVKSISRNLNYDQREKSTLLWALGLGTFIGVWPFNYLYLHFGARYVFFGAGLLSAFSTALIPTTAYMSLTWFAIVRVFQGIAYAADFAAIGIITVRWASLKQNGLFIAVLTSFNSLSTIVTNSVSGLKCKSNYFLNFNSNISQFAQFSLCESSLGWPAVYYMHSAFGLFIFIVWLSFYRDQPEMHKNISEIELEKIYREKSNGYRSDNKIPYLAIIKNPVILTVWFNAFVEIVSGLFLLSYGPTYLKFVLKFRFAFFSIEGTGFLVALQGLSFLPVRIIAGFMSDKIKCMKEYQKMVLFNSLSLVGAGVLYSILGFIPINYPVTSVIVIAATHAVMAFNVGGFYKCGTFVARQYSHFVISNIQFIKCFALFISPLFVAIFVSEDSAQEQWRIIFIIMAISLLVANIIFCFLATDKAGKFTILPSTEKKQTICIATVS
ncbi:unnamed protein product [Thelazia callipaeda]|uniref:MFS domain-containing protein n=1 Tax=Thelazia callipaeda TaxID=103827 RepID=A0A0N5D3E7_THECL|nr:unnamed protein product [Thelazia callipaeda]